jgi:pimeloyl-ACP methyl ester carboxylesterase
MSRFGLVHGAGLGAWCWDRLIPELEAHGHQAATVDLPLNDHSAGASSLAQTVLDAFAGIDDLVIVGHSISGLIIPVTASCRFVRRLVFLHAVLP